LIQTKQILLLKVLVLVLVLAAWVHSVIPQQLSQHQNGRILKELSQIQLKFQIFHMDK
jgi:hypothetical protein